MPHACHMFLPQEGLSTMATAKLSSLVSKSTKSNDVNSQEDQMAASTAVAPRYVVLTLAGKSKKNEEFASHWLVSAKPLSEAECAAMLNVFDVAVAGKPRKSFERKFFRGMTAVMTKAGLPGGAMYWLAGEEVCGLDQVKAMVEDVLGSAKGKKGKADKPAAQQPQDAPEKGKAAKGGKKVKNTHAEAAKDRSAKRNSYTVFLG